MIECKLFELRDRATFIPIFAFRNRVILQHADGWEIHHQTTQETREDWLLRRAGFGSQSQHLVTVADVPIAGNPRTYGVAHKYIEEHWNDLRSGDVIDVEFILGETKTKKRSEYYDEYEHNS